MGPSPYHSSPYRNNRIEFSRFNGDDVIAWIYKVVQYFSYEYVPSTQGVKDADMYFNGDAIAWHLSYMKSMGNLPLPSWDEYLLALNENFGEIFVDSMIELKKLK